MSELAEALGNREQVARLTAEIAALRQHMAQAASRLMANDIDGAIGILETASRRTDAGIAVLARLRRADALAEAVEVSHGWPHGRG
jgi:hypothetical protein